MEEKKKIAEIMESKEKSSLVGAESICNDNDCPWHGNLKTRGRTFRGIVIKKFHKRVVIEFERMIYVRKYERYLKSKTRIHARLPICIEDKINIGDYIKIKECRPLSKMIHFVVIDKIKSSQNNNKGVKK